MYLKIFENNWKIVNDWGSQSEPTLDVVLNQFMTSSIITRN